MSSRILESPIFTLEPSNPLINKKDKLRELLNTQGAILLRGFNIDSPEKFRTLVTRFSDEFIQHNPEHVEVENFTGIFTPVGYSAKEKLLWHNENSYNNSFPTLILFCAARPADVGGETPIVDSHKVYQNLDPEIVEEFVSKGVMYTRTHGFGFGVDWQALYGVDDKNVLEKICKRKNILLEWVTEDKLITRQVQPSIIKHPVTNKYSWFNQALHWHPYCLKAKVRESLLEMLTPETLPRNCYFGDGSVISDDIIQHIIDVYEKLEITFQWQQGDVMILDNIQYAHARNPYVGERKLLVAMCENISV